MQEERAFSDAPDGPAASSVPRDRPGHGPPDTTPSTESSGEPTYQAPPTDRRPPLFGTKESAAGLPYAVDEESAHLTGLGPSPVSTLAAPARRLAARVLDIVAVGVVFTVANEIVMAVAFPELRQLAIEYLTDPTPELFNRLERAVASWAWVSTVLLAVVWFCYEVPSTATRGRTLGKLAVGIKVVGGVTGRVGWSATMLRWLILAAPILLLSLFGLPIQALDCGWMLTDRKTRRCLHDKPANTHVTKVRPASSPR